MVRPAEIALPYLIGTAYREPPRVRTLALSTAATVAGHRAAVRREGKHVASLPDRE